MWFNSVPTHRLLVKGEHTSSNRSSFVSFSDEQLARVQAVRDANAPPEARLGDSCSVVNLVCKVVLPRLFISDRISGDGSWVLVLRSSVAMPPAARDGPKPEPCVPVATVSALEHRFAPGADPADPSPASPPRHASSPSARGGPSSPVRDEATASPGNPAGSVTSVASSTTSLPAASQRDARDARDADPASPHTQNRGGGGGGGGGTAVSVSTTGTAEADEGQWGDAALVGAPHSPLVVPMPHDEPWRLRGGAWRPASDALAQQQQQQQQQQQAQDISVFSGLVDIERKGHGRHGKWKAGRHKDPNSWLCPVSMVYHRGDDTRALTITVQVPDGEAEGVNGVSSPPAKREGTPGRAHSQGVESWRRQPCMVRLTLFEAELRRFALMHGAESTADTDASPVVDVELCRTYAPKLADALRLVHTTKPDTAPHSGGGEAERRHDDGTAPSPPNPRSPGFELVLHMQPHRATSPRRKRWVPRCALSPAEYKREAGKHTGARKSKGKGKRKVKKKKKKKKGATSGKDQDGPDDAVEGPHSASEQQQQQQQQRPADRSSPRKGRAKRTRRKAAPKEATKHAPPQRKPAVPKQTTRRKHAGGSGDKSKRPKRGRKGSKKKPTTDSNAQPTDMPDEPSHAGDATDSANPTPTETKKNTKSAPQPPPVAAPPVVLREARQFDTVVVAATYDGTPDSVQVLRKGEAMYMVCTGRWRDDTDPANRLNVLGYEPASGAVVSVRSRRSRRCGWGRCLCLHVW